MLSTRQWIGVIVLVVVATAAVTAAAMYFTLRIRGYGRIITVGLGAYADAGATQEVDVIDWGEIPPGGSSAATIYLKSNSSVPVTMSLDIENWNPSAAAGYMTVNWNYDGSALQPGEVRSVTFTLRVSGSITGISRFEFDLVITAAG